MWAELAWLSIEEVAPLVAKRRLSPRELLDALLGHIERNDPLVNAFITVDAERSRRDARRAEADILRGRYRGPLHGIPVALKDNIWTAGLRTTAGSKILAQFVPVEDATVVRRLRRAGAVIVGKTNMSEFAYGATNNNPHYGAAHNPWNLERTTGGSSGGSAAAVAAGFAFAALGTDTGGSIRIPSALCGVVGLKPTFGRVSCHGTMPLVPSYDHVGPIARSAVDAAIVLSAIAGRDRRDPATRSVRVPDFVHDSRPGGRLHLGRPVEFFFERIAPEVTSGVDAVVRAFEAAGAEVRDVRLPETARAAERCTAFAYTEATMVHRRVGYFPARQNEYGDDVRRRLALGAEVLAVDYAAEADARRLLRAEFAAALAAVDAILAPAVPVAATVIGQRTVRIASSDEAVRAALIRLNRPANITGLPAITVPCGFTRDGLPVGVQLIGRPFEEARLLQIARVYLESTRRAFIPPAAIAPVTAGHLESIADASRRND
ncbi:MAG TPA: amidase [Vicinamibacterales bacterium]|jgi:aspartyl-tRNA(Asn)/glutamyl-tRNA(Gln) amidotransferase subunit A|nr:amidase [Vicinamibacterales bacterium]